MPITANKIIKQWNENTIITLIYVQLNFDTNAQTLKKWGRYAHVLHIADAIASSWGRRPTNGIELLFEVLNPKIEQPTSCRLKVKIVIHVYSIQCLQINFTFLLILSLSSDLYTMRGIILYIRNHMIKWVYFRQSLSPIKFCRLPSC